MSRIGRISCFVGLVAAGLLSFSASAETANPAAGAKVKKRYVYVVLSSPVPGDEAEYNGWYSRRREDSGLQGAAEIHFRAGRPKAEAAK